jgi:hypothetical protein
MPKCPRSGAKLTTPFGAVVTAVPIGFTDARRQQRSNAICVQVEGETMVSVVKEGRKVLVPLAQLSPATRMTVAPRTHLMHIRNDRPPQGEPKYFVQPGNLMLNGADAGSSNKYTLKFYTGPVNARPIAAKLREVGYAVTVGTEHVYVRQGGGSRYDAESEVLSRLLARFGTNFGLGQPVGRAGLGFGVPGDPDMDVLRLYGKCVKKCRRHAPANLGPCIDQCQEKGGAVGGLAGTEDYHAHSASMWSTNAIEEAELGAGDALNKGQCNRALESLVRAERKTTMASTNATQSGNDRLKEKARASNALVNAMWREFQTKCIRRYPGDHPGSVLPFGGVGGDLHERIAAVLGWSVQDTQSFSMHSLRELVRPLDPRLAQEISDSIEGGHHILQRGFGAAPDEKYVHPRATKVLRVGDYANTVMAGGHLKTVEVVEVFPNGMLAVVGVNNPERHIVDPRTTYKMPQKPGSLRGLGDVYTLPDKE